MKTAPERGLARCSVLEPEGSNQALKGFLILGGCPSAPLDGDDQRLTVGVKPKEGEDRSPTRGSAFVEIRQ